MYTLKNRIKRFIITGYHALSLDKLRMFIGGFDSQINIAIQKFGRNSHLSEKELKRDIKKCYYRYLTTPDEYFLFGFEGMNDSYRNSFLSDNTRLRYLIKIIGEKKFVNELCDKYNFYKLTSRFFKRKIIQVGGKSLSLNDFKFFISEHKKLFVKPVSSSFGQGAHVLQIDNNTDINELNDIFLRYNNGNWIMEDLIIQSPEMSVWNESSVNTVRLPCSLNNGKFYIINPFFRTGRKGKVVDNGGGGGVFACIDENSGIVVTDGIDERNIQYTSHPDSKKVFKGWQVPQWGELKKLAEEIFRTCLPDHKYIGFDFAYTNNGWVLIEGNWGQFLGQYASKQGIKDTFIQSLS